MDASREVEIAYAAFASDYATAAGELNPYSDCATLPLGAGVAVYSGVLSPIHGVYGAGLDGPIERSDLAAVDQFFQKAERDPVWHATEVSMPFLREHFNEESAEVEFVAVFEFDDELPLPTRRATVPEDHRHWLLAHTRSCKGHNQVKEPDLYSSIVLHMKNTRLYLHPDQSDAGFTHFSGGGALAFARRGQTVDVLLSQLHDAKEYGARWFALAGSPQTPRGTENLSHRSYKRMRLSRVR